MIRIESKANCTGCSACSMICPKKCISMKQDEEGFFYPSIDAEHCSKCGICETICPINNLHVLPKSELPNAYLAYEKDTSVRINSAAGGVFAGLAKYVIKELNGVVFGAVYDENFNVYHSYTETIDKLPLFQKSKYVQSDMRHSFFEVKQFLDSGRHVLFSGTACQIYGLKSFLKKEYPQLFCIDLICYGVPSPKVFSRYLDYMTSKYGEIEKVIVRDKQIKKNRFQMGYGIKFKNGYYYFAKHNTDPMARIFYGKIASRPSCYQCPYKTLWRISDLTVGDCWYGSEYIPGYVDKYGITLTLCQSQKGKDLLFSCDSIIKHQVPTEDIAKVNGGMLYSSCNKPKNREEFFSLLDKHTIQELADLYFPIEKEPLKARVRSFLSDRGLLPKWIDHMYRKKKVKQMIIHRQIPDNAKGICIL